MFIKITVAIKQLIFNIRSALNIVIAVTIKLVLWCWVVVWVSMLHKDKRKRY